MEPLHITWRVLVGTTAGILDGTAEHYDLEYDVYNLNAIEQLSVSETMVVANGQPGGRLFVAERPDGAFEEVPKPGALWGEHVLLESELIASAFEGRGELYIRHPDGTVRPVQDRSGTRGGRPGRNATDPGVAGTGQLNSPAPIR